MKQRWLLIITTLSLAMLAASCGILDSISEKFVEYSTIEQKSTFTPIPVITATAIPEITATSIPDMTQTDSEPVVLTKIAPTISIDEINFREQTAEIITIDENYVYAVQLGSPIAMPNWSHPELECSWMAVAGQIFGLDGKPEIGIVLESGGLIGEQDILGLSVTGLIDLYGPGSYEIQLFDRTVATQDKLWVQVKGISGENLSPKIYFDTYEDCGQNLILMNFIQVEPYSLEYHVYMPWINHEAP